MANDRPVGLFDSGVGGVSILRHVRDQLPFEQCIYLADSREFPYGTKPAPDIKRRCERIVDFLLEQRSKAIVVACNTASVTALAHLRARYAPPFVGIVPGVKPAAGLTRTGTIGVLATPTTADSEPLAQLIEQFAYGVAVKTQICPGLVSLVERGITDGPEVEMLARRYLDPLLDAGADVIVLGCTHYPLLRTAIQRICGPDVTLVDPSDAVARQLGRILASHGLASEGPAGPMRYYTTGEPDELGRVLTALAGSVAGTVAHADI